MEKLTKASIFINYRRTCSAEWAKDLYERLSLRFGKDLIFQDVESIPLSVKWMDKIREEINQCEIFLVIIGFDWLELADKKGNRRLDNEQDILRMEIIEALKANCSVIPVLVDGAAMPSKEKLPDPMRALTQWQAVTLSSDKWNEDTKELIEQLRDLIKPTRGVVSLGNVRQEAYELQLEYFELKDKNIAEAFECAQKLSRFLDRNLPLFPYDDYLKVCRGFSLKNEAMALDQLGRKKEFDETLDEAERIFRAMRAENPKDADAWNGSGSVEILRGNYDKALDYINKCLEIKPDHKYALQDKQEIENKKSGIQNI